MPPSSRAEANSRSTSLNVRLYASYSTLMRTITASSTLASLFARFGPVLGVHGHTRHKNLRRSAGIHLRLVCSVRRYFLTAGAAAGAVLLAVWDLCFFVPFFLDLAAVLDAAGLLLVVLL